MSATVALKVVSCICLGNIAPQSNTAHVSKKHGPAMQHGKPTRATENGRCATRNDPRCDYCERKCLPSHRRETQHRIPRLKRRTARATQHDKPTSQATTANGALAVRGDTRRNNCWLRHSDTPTCIVRQRKTTSLQNESRPPDEMRKKARGARARNGQRQHPPRTRTARRQEAKSAAICITVWLRVCHSPQHSKLEPPINHQATL